MGSDAPTVRLTSSGPTTYTTLFLQMTHARHHTIASPMTHCNSHQKNEMGEWKVSAPPAGGSRDSTYVYLESDHHHPGLFSHCLFVNRHLPVSIIRRRESTVCRPQYEVVCLPPVPHERRDISPRRQVEKQGAEDEHFGVGAGEGPLTAASGVECQCQCSLRGGSDRTVSYARKYIAVRDSTVKTPMFFVRNFADRARNARDAHRIRGSKARSRPCYLRPSKLNPG